MEGKQHHPERTCVGCRLVRKKEEVVRLVAGPGGLVIDYREKLPGRAAYVCPRRACIAGALTREAVARSLHLKVKLPDTATFVAMLIAIIRERIASLIKMSAKAGKLAAGSSAVRDALEKGRAELLLYAEDLAEGTKDRVQTKQSAPLREATLFTRDELGGMLHRELVGVIAIEDQGFANALWRETERLKGLINISE